MIYKKAQCVTGGPANDKSAITNGKTQTMAKDAEGMRGIRSRDENGQLRDKRDDTQMGTVEKQYGRDFGVRSDMELGKFLEQKGFKSLHELIQSDVGKK